MTRTFSILFSLLLILTVSPAHAGENPLAPAATAYGKEDYEGSRKLLEALHAGGQHSPESWLLAGHVAARANDIPNAILAYRRALLLDPAHPEARQNLQVLTSRQGIPEALPPPPILGWLNSLPRGWFWLAGSIGIWLTIGGGLVLWIGKTKAAVLPAVLAMSLGGTTLVATLAGGITLWRAENAAPTAKNRLWRPDGQLARTTSLRSTPARRGAAIIESVPAGTSLRVIQEEGWTYVEVPGGAGSPPVRGWIEKDSWLALWPFDRSLLRSHWP